MADLEQSLEELEAVKQSFKENINNTGISTSSVEFRNMPNLINQMEKKLPVQTKSVNPTTSSQSITADAGYKLTKVEVGAVNPSDYYKPEESLVVEPKTTSQTFNAPSGKVYNSVSVGAVTSAIDEDIIPTNIRKGKTILGVTGNLEADKPGQSKTVNPSTSTQRVFADSGFELSDVTVNAVTREIDTNIKAENIRAGVDILGVTGTLEEHGAPKLQSKTVYPTTNLQQVTADSGYDGLSKVDVSAVTSAIDANIKAENIKSGTTILGVTGTLEEGGGGDLIDVDELPSENVEDDKVYRVDKIVGEYVYGWPGEGPMPLGALYTEIFVDDIDSVTNPQVSDMENYSLVIYTDTRTYTGYIFIDEAGTRATLAEMFGLDASKNHGLLYDDFSTITDAGVYYVVYANSTIGVPMISTTKEIMEYVKGEWKKYSRISNDMVVGLWFNPNTNEYLELKSTGEMNIKSSTGEVVYVGSYFASYNKSEAKNVVWLTYNSMEDILDYVVTEDGVKLGDFVKQSELVVPAVGGLPIDITTDAEMTNALTEANVGKVYKFTGTSDTYETDAIYIISEV